MPRYLTERDHGWIARVLEEHEAHAGKRKVELDRRLRDLDVFGRMRSKLHLLLAVIERLERTEPEATISPREARALTFRHASRFQGARETVLERAAAELGIVAPELEAALFADLKSERRVRPLGTPSPEALAAAANVALVKAIVSRSSTVRVRAWGNALPLVRRARRAGLICVARRGADSSLELDVSGPAALFTRSRIYGGALASLLSALPLCDRFELRALAAFGASEAAGTLCVRSGDRGVAPAEMGPAHSELERRLERDLRRLAPSWELLADPAPLEVDGVLSFPDFELVKRGDPASRHWLEIVGFWTPSYLKSKLERLERAGMQRIVLSVDARKSCGPDDLPHDERMLTHRTRIDVAALLQRLEPSHARASAPR